MSYCPRTLVGPCLHCGQQPDVQWSWLLSRVRLACDCGVSGAWMPYDRSRGLGDPWHSAVSGWHGVALPSPPPKPRG